MPSFTSTKNEDSQRIFEDQQGQFVALAHENNRTDVIRIGQPLSEAHEIRKPNAESRHHYLASHRSSSASERYLDVRSGVRLRGRALHGRLHRMPKNASSPKPRSILPRVHIGPSARILSPAYRAGFEVRTYRLCQRVLMFHHFPDELGTPDYLVRSTEFTYNLSPIASFITQVTQSGYVRQPDGTYFKKSLPPLSFEYSEAVIHDEIETIDAESLQNLPIGADGCSTSGSTWMAKDYRRPVGAGRGLVLQAQPAVRFQP